MKQPFSIAISALAITMATISVPIALAQTSKPAPKASPPPQSQAANHAEIFHSKETSKTFAATQTTALPASFTNSTIFSGLNQPTKVAFASDGRVFVAEKSGIIKVFPSLTNPNYTIFADLSTEVMNYWDRGLLGIALNPDFPNTPYVYVSYTLDAPKGGTPPVFNDACSDPTGVGCTVAGRLSRLTANGNTMVAGSEKVIIEDWCQQYPSHSIGDIRFAPDRSLYMSGGEGANFNTVDYGQLGGNPCGDPANEGGALRAQDIRTTSDPLGYSGSIIRVNPDTGAALSTNPLYGGSYAADDPFIAYGFRNPFRFTINPNTNEVWVADVGMDTWEEVNRIPNPLKAPILNFGWPCYEGADQQPGYAQANIPLCQSLYSAGNATGPYYTYNHNGSNASITGVSFYTGSTYPSSYTNALFMADYSVGWIKVMFPGTNGLPDPSNITTFATGVNPVDLETGPNGDIFYIDFVSGELHRIQYAAGNHPPTAVIKQDTTNGPLPLTVHFDGSGSYDQDAGDTITYSWDLDGNGVFGDSTAVNPQYTYTRAGNYKVGLQVTDNHGAVGTAYVTIAAGNRPPVVTISAPTPSTTYKVGDTVNYSGSAIDPDNSTIFGSFFPGAHPETFNHVQTYWTPGPTANYPYAGKSTVARGSDTGETGAPSPTGVYDLQLHPPNNNHLTVAAFNVPKDGSYTVNNLAARRVDGNVGQTSRFKVFNSAKTLLANIQTTSQAWTKSSSSYNLGSLHAGDTIYFAVDPDGGYWYDATEIAWRVTGSIGGKSYIWNSYDTTVQAGPPQAILKDTTGAITTSLKFYESINDGGVDYNDGTMPASALTWQITLFHCSDTDATQCHQHPLQTVSGQTSGSITAPDHEYPSHLEFTLTATEPPNGDPNQVALSGSATVDIQPQTVKETFQSNPSGLSETVYSVAHTTPFTKTFVVNATTGLSTTSPQALNGTNYTFSSWSDGGAISHNITSTATAQTFTANFVASGAAPMVWQSYNVKPQAGSPQATVTDSNGSSNTAKLEFYESTNDGGVDEGALLSTFTSGLHVDTFNNVNNFWSNTAGGGYPYVGKSSVARGSDAGEANTPNPTGVFDLQLHPPNSNHLAVAAFIAPVAGTYSVSGIAARRVDANAGQTSRFKVFNPAKTLIDNVQATSQAWVTDGQTYSLGKLNAGDKIYFAVDPDGPYWYDATEVAWSLQETP